MEVVGAMVIVAVLGAVMIPVVYQRLREARVDAIIQEFETIRSGLFMFYRDVGKYPPRVDYLTGLPTSPAPVDLCNRPLTARNIAGYRGPYLSRQIVPLTLVPIPVLRYVLTTGDSVSLALTRTTISGASGASTEVIQLQVFGPEDDITRMIDERVDGSYDGSAGVIHWTGSDNEFTVRYNIPIRNPC